MGEGINLIEINNLYKSYGNNDVLKDISLSLEENRIYGLFGRNGAGKTTLLNIISNQIPKTKGEVRIFGEDVFENSKQVENICMVKDSGFGVEEIKVKKIFEAARILYKDWDEDYKNYLIKELNLNIRKKYSKLSRGNQTKVGLIIGLASRAKLTIFDEPALGLDAATRYKFYNLLLDDFEKHPRTIIISTHLIDEVTNLFEEVIILKDSQIYLKDEVTNILEKGYFLNGKEENIIPLIKDKNIIHKEEFGSSIVLGIFDELSEYEKAELKKNNVEVSQIPLQKIFIYLTESPHKGGNVNGWSEKNNNISI